MLSNWQIELAKDKLVQRVLEVGEERGASDFGMSVKELQYHLERLRHLHDLELFSLRRLKITDKETGSIIPFKFNGGQRKLNAAVERQRRSGKPVRIKLLKARQWGGSTEWEGLVYRELILKPLRNAMIVAHDLDSARHLRDMTTRYYEYDDYPKPRMKKETDKWWKFMHTVANKRADSNLRIDTAEEISIGHSLTNQILHLSEIQNWRNAQILVKGLFPTVPDVPETMILMEGTGSGVGDFWYEECMASMAGGAWEFVFVAWFEVEWYQMRFDNQDKRANLEAKLDAEEKVLYHQGVTLEQLNWRRYKINETYKGDVDSFRQQYPATADEAFLSSGRPVFNPNKVREAMLRTKPAIRIGNLEWTKKDELVKFIEQERGLWEIWEEPESVENLYCLGADVAEGIAVVPELGNKGGDFSSAKVFNRQKRKFVGRIHARLDPDMFEEELAKAGIYWGCGILVENNPGGSGNVVIRGLKERHGLNLLKTVTLDRIHDTVKEQYGWDTNKESKREMIDELNELIREEKFQDFSKNFWYEASTYIRDEKGRTNAQSRKFDDEVVATALAFQADKIMPMFFRDRDEEKREITADMDVAENWKKGFTPTSQSRIMEENYV